MDDQSLGASSGQPSGQARKTSPWVYLGVGCAILFVLFILIIGAVTMWGYRAIKSQITENKDPVTRTQSVKRILGCKGDLPEGYHAFMKLSIPWIMDMAILSDREPDGHDSKPIEKRGFIYIKTIRGGSDKKMRDYFEGKADAAELLEKGSINITSNEEIARGSFEMDGYTTYYTSHRGTIQVHRDRVAGITSVFFIDCPSDHKFRMGVWFGPNPEAEESASEKKHRSDLEHRTESDRGSAEGRQGGSVSKGRDGEGEWGGDQGRSTDRAAADRRSGRDAESEPSRRDAESEGSKQSGGTESGRHGEKSAESGVTMHPAGPEYAGTTADEKAMREFLSHFSPCEAPQ